MLWSFPHQTRARMVPNASGEVVEETQYIAIPFYQRPYIGVF